MTTEIRTEKVLNEIDETVALIHKTLEPAMKRLSDLLDDEDVEVRRAAADALLDAVVSLGSIALVGRRSWRQ